MTAKTENRGAEYAQHVFNTVAESYDMRPDELYGNKQPKKYGHRRWLVVYILYMTAELSGEEMCDTIGQVRNTSMKKYAAAIENMLIRNDDGIQDNLAYVKEALGIGEIPRLDRWKKNTDGRRFVEVSASLALSPSDIETLRTVNMKGRWKDKQDKLMDRLDDLCYELGYKLTPLDSPEVVAPMTIQNARPEQMTEIINDVLSGKREMGSM